MIVRRARSEAQPFVVEVKAEDFNPNRVEIKRVFLVHKQTSTDIIIYGIDTTTQNDQLKSVIENLATQVSECLEKCHVKEIKNIADHKDYQNRGTGSHYNIQSADKKTSRPLLGKDNDTQIETDLKSVQDDSFQTLSEPLKEHDSKSYSERGSGSFSDIWLPDEEALAERPSEDSSIEIDGEARQIQGNAVQNSDSSENSAEYSSDEWIHDWSKDPPKEEGTGSSNILSADKKLSTRMHTEGRDTQTEEAPKPKTQENSTQCQCLEKSEQQRAEDKKSDRKFCHCSRVGSFCNINSIVFRGSSECSVKQLRKSKGHHLSDLDKKKVSSNKTSPTNSKIFLEELHKQSKEIKELRSLIEMNLLRRKPSSRKTWCR